MFGKNKLEEMLAQKDNEIKELNARLSEYQSRNDAVVGALAEAKAAATRILAAADVKRDEIIAAAEAEKKEISAQRDSILDDAKAEAEAIIRAAMDKAREAEDRAEFFRNYVKESADAVRRQAENYAAFLGEYEVSGIGAAPCDKTVETPDEYADPAELMHSIYDIQGRDIPEEAKQPEEDGEPAQSEEEVPTVSEVVTDGKQEEQFSVDKELNDILNDILKLD